MTIGPGKYDEEASSVMNSTKAAMVMVIAVNGDRGTGFSVQCVDPRLLINIPSVLRTMADQIEGDVNNGVTNVELGEKCKHCKGKGTVDIPEDCGCWTLGKCSMCGGTGKAVKPQAVRHKPECITNVDRECGLCNCGAE